MSVQTRRTDEWRKSESCGASPNCVEVALRREGAAVRDSKDPRGPVLEFDAGEWAAFLEGVRGGQFDLPAA